MARYGSAQLSKVQLGMPQLSMIRHGPAQLCKVWLDIAWHGLAWLLAAQLSVV